MAEKGCENPRHRARHCDGTRGSSGCPRARAGARRGSDPRPENLRQKFGQHFPLHRGEKTLGRRAGRGTRAPPGGEAKMAPVIRPPRVAGMHFGNLPLYVRLCRPSLPGPPVLSLISQAAPPEGPGTYAARRPADSMGKRTKDAASLAILAVWGRTTTAPGSCPR